MILADTGFFIALSNNGDRYHSRAIQVISTLREPLITTYPVITETSYLLARDAGLAIQFEFLTEVALMVRFPFSISKGNIFLAWLS